MVNKSGESKGENFQSFTSKYDVSYTFFFVDALHTVEELSFYPDFAENFIINRC